MLNKIRKMESMEEIVSVPATIEYKDAWELKINDNGKETTRLFSNKKEAKKQLNTVKKSLVKMFNLEEYYSEKSNWYEILILANMELNEDEIADGKNITLEIKLVEEEIMEEE